MFKFLKQIAKDLEDDYQPKVEVPAFDPNKVYCDECKNWLDKKEAQEVESLYDRPYYFCPLHKKNYDVLYITGYGRTQYKKMVEVDEQGNPLK